MNLNTKLDSNRGEKDMACKLLYFARWLFRFKYRLVANQCHAILDFYLIAVLRNFFYVSLPRLVCKSEHPVHHAACIVRAGLHSPEGGRSSS